MQKAGLFILYLVLVALAEFVTNLVDPGYGLSLHAMVLISLLALSALKHSENPISNLLLSLSLAPLIRIISLSLPLAYFPRYAWYLVAGAALLLATLTLMRVQGVGFRDVGVTFYKPLTQAAVGLTGIPFGAIEYYILRPEPLAAGPLSELVLLSIALIIFTGFTEEMVFRGVMQRSATEALGWKAGVLGVNTVFAVLHIGWLSPLDMIFVFSIGLFFGLITLKTGSIMGVSLSHGITNVILFLVTPSIAVP
jgi:membrane protease YdiL (CAAX protease family)